MSGAPEPSRPRTGVWLIGARGSLAVTTLAGAAALAAGEAPPVGCVSATEPFSRCALPDFPSLVFGGHDTHDVPLTVRAARLADDGVIPRGLPHAVADRLAEAETRLRPGVAADDPRPQAEQIATLTADLTAFRAGLALDRVVVVNVSTTEPVTTPLPAHADAAHIAGALAAGEAVLPPSARYAWAAAAAGCPFVDFTPSAGIRLPGVAGEFTERGLPYAGNDGKTGETLLKTVLAPMFAQRALRVRTWSGTNLLGGGDGAALAEPDRAAAKTESKDRALRELLGHPVGGGVHIHHVPELGEWKTAWDLVTFEGFLGTPMSLQFTWQGCDSALAAPLVLDLARFTARAHECGIRGPLGALAFYFKDPVGGAEHALSTQYHRLVEWAGRELTHRPGGSP